MLWDISDDSIDKYFKTIMMEKDRIIEEMLTLKAEENNVIDLNAYGIGLADMYDKLVKLFTLHCTCSKEDKHGETSVRCCNACGKPTENFWQSEQLKCPKCGNNNKRVHNIKIMNTAKVENKDLPVFASVTMSGKDGYKQDGLTKREYFALHLMQGLLTGADRHSQEGDCQTWNYEHLSEISIQAADALLSKL